MKIPPSVSIGGQEVEIVIEKDLAEYGLFCLDDMRITLRSADTDIMESTLRHEMMHAAFSIAGISHSKTFEDMEECVVREKFELLRDNSMDGWMTIGEYVGKPSIKYIQNLILSYDGYEVPDKDAKDILDGVGISQKNVSTITYKLVPIEQ
jgi:hypothetical protein